MDTFGSRTVTPLTVCGKLPAAALVSSASLIVSAKTAGVCRAGSVAVAGAAAALRAVAVAAPTDPDGVARAVAGAALLDCRNAYAPPTNARTSTMRISPPMTIFLTLVRPGSVRGMPL